MKETDTQKEFKLILPKKEKEFLKEGEHLIVRNIKGDIITLVKPLQAGIEQFRGIWENENVDQVFKIVAKQWKAWRKRK